MLQFITGGIYMPSTITHTYISLDTLKRVKRNPKKIIDYNLEDYKTFAQGMDILYFYHILLLKSNRVQQLGHQFHNYKTNEIFKYIINYCKQNKSDIAFTFLSGLITHYIADSTMHPYINYLSQSDTKLKHQDNHFEIETTLDNYMVNKKEGFYQTFKNYQLQFNNKPNKEIITLIDNMYEKYFNYHNMGKKYYQGQKEMRFIFKYARFDKTGFKRKIYQLIDQNKLKVRRTTYLSYHFKLNNLERYLNNAHKTWYYTKDPNIISNKSFEELYEIVTKKTANIINQLYDYIYNDKSIDLDILLENKSYSTGLILK